MKNKTKIDLLHWISVRLGSDGAIPWEGKRSRILSHLLFVPKLIQVETSTDCNSEISVVCPSLSVTRPNFLLMCLLS